MATQVNRQAADPYQASPSGYLQNSSLSFDFQAVLAAVYRSRFWVAGIICLSLILGVIVSLLSTPIYRGEASIQIDQEAAQVLGTEDQAPAGGWQETERFLQTQLDVIRSRAIAILVAEDLGLFGNPQFLREMNADPEIEATPTMSADEIQRRRVLTLLRENLEVALPADSRVAEIRFLSPSPTLAANVANSFAENYIRSNLERKFATSSYAREFLRERLDEVRGQLEESEREALEYARATQIIDTSGAGSQGSSGPRSLTTATLVQLNQDYANALAERISAEERWERASAANPLTLAAVLQNSAVQRLIERRAQLQAELEQQLERRRDDFPAVRQARAQLEEIDRQIDTLATNIRSSFQNDYQTALANEQAIQAQLQELKAATLNEQSQAVRLGILQRSAETDRQLYDQLLTRYNELSAEAGVQANNVSIVDPAEVTTTPVSPNIPLNMALAMLGGVALSGFVVFGREQLFDIVRTPDDARRAAGMSLLGAVPISPPDSDVATEAHDPKTPISEAYNSVATALLLASERGLPSSLVVTSSRAGEGKSSSAYSIGLSLARVGKRIVLVDCDLRRPNLHTLLDTGNKRGMSELLSGNASINDVLRSSPYPNLNYITSGEIPPNPTELFVGERFEELVRTLEQEYDCVIVDSAPVLSLADAVAIGSRVRSLVFVIQSGGNLASNVGHAVNRLVQGGAKPAGVILSRYDSRSAGYGYESSYSYSYGD